MWSTDSVPFQVLITAVFVVTGTINTLNTKAIHLVRANNTAGEYVEFNHPVFQINIMMLGMMLCMPVYFIYIYCQKQNGSNSNLTENLPEQSKVIFLPTALFDVVVSAMNYGGLYYTSVSQFQMLRGTNIIFIGLLSVIFLKRRLEWFKWTGMAVVIIGTVMVGAADFFKKTEDAGVSNAVIGDIIIVSAQVLMAFKYVYQEKIISKYNVHPLEVVGCEGVFGFIALVLIQISFYFVRIDGFQLGYNPDGRLEDSLDAFTQMNNSPQLYGYFCLGMLSVGVFNFALVSIIKQRSATTMKLLDTLRTVLIWFCSMMFYFVDERWGMPSFKDEFWLQLSGFFCIVIGVFLYSDILILPFIRKMKAPKKILPLYNDNNN